MFFQQEIASDASTLIYLAKAQAYDLISACQLTLLVSPGVWREAVEAGEAAGYADTAAIRAAEEVHRLKRVDLTESQERRASTIATAHKLGQGESEAISLGDRGALVFVDDGRARRVAQSLGLVPISTLFLPEWATRGRRMTTSDALARLQLLATAANARAETVIALEARIRQREP